MKRILAALTAALLLFAGAAAEGAKPVPASPTDLCAHNHTETVRYFEAPSYNALDDKVHSVSGRAVVEVVCLDCGALLSSTEEDAEEIRPHTFRKGRCVLCGREKNAGSEDPDGRAEPENPAEAENPAVPEIRAEQPAPAEDRVIILPPETAGSGRYVFTISGQQLDGAAGNLVLRPRDCDAALVLQAESLLEEVDPAGGIRAEIESSGSGSIRASVRLYDASGEESVPGTRKISLRIYSAGGGVPLTVSWTGPEGGTGREEAGWVHSGGGEGYWNVPWLGNGNYTY